MWPRKRRTTTNEEQAVKDYIEGKPTQAVIADGKRRKSKLPAESSDSQGRLF